MPRSTAGERISSSANPAVKAARRLARRPPRGSRELLVEGPQAVAEAIGHLRRLFVTDAAAERHPDLVASVRRAGAQVLPCTEEVLAAVSDTVNSQGLAGVATLPTSSLDELPSAASLMVVLVEVRDPGNLGAVIRTADAAGADAVVLVGNCVAPRNPKVVRASAGSLFHLPVIEQIAFPELADICARHGITLLAADAAGTVDHTAVDLRAPSALVFGNEAHGLTAAITAACDHVVRVPIAAPVRPGWSGAAESLNLAATVAVIAFEAARQRKEGR